MTNPDTKPVYVCVSFGIDEMTGQCVNQPLNASKAQGTAFHPDITITGAQYLNPALVDDTGKATSEICWDKSLTEYVQDYIDTTYNCSADPYVGYCGGDDLCVNPNWWFDQYGWTLKRMYVLHASYQYDTKGNLSSISPICRECIAPGDECGFTCTTMKDASACNSLGLDTICLQAVTNPTP